jgi:thymidylate synthase (FAD)
MIQVEPFAPPWGNDETVADAARVSFAKRASLFVPELNHKLIRYLAKNRHWSPFAHPAASFRITAPIFVARQLAKHQVGFAWNEESRRYIDDRADFYAPEAWRERPQGGIKQGSGGAMPPNAQETATSWMEHAYEACEQAYSQMLVAGVAPEQARMVLPLGCLTSWIWSGSLYGWARVCRLRLDPHAQGETRIVAEKIASHMREWFPVSWAALTERTEDAD